MTSSSNTVVSEAAGGAAAGGAVVGSPPAGGAVGGSAGAAAVTSAAMAGDGIVGTSRMRSAKTAAAAGPAVSRAGAVVLAPGLRVVERDDRTVQIGVEPPLRILVRNPPPGTTEVLRLLAQGVPLVAATRRVAVSRGMPTDTWSVLIGDLLAGGFLLRTPHAGPTPRPADGFASRSAAHRANAATSPPATSLADAVVVVSGSGRVASSVASLLAAAGTGHVHLDPDRALRPGDAIPAGPTPADLAGAASVLPFDPGRRRGARGPDRHSDPAGPADRETLAHVVRRARPGIAVHRPAGYVRPGLVVLATDGPPPPELVRRLVDEGQPHLAARAGEFRGVVGPLVLPGRSSCLHCHDLHRRDSDAGWPQVLLELRHTVAPPPVVLATSTAALAASQALQYLGGGRPSTVDGTVECTPGDWRVRRRTWRPHPGCFCQFR
jgi:hypothetical protein